jgi:hypothetical protein
VDGGLLLYISSAQHNPTWLLLSITLSGNSNNMTMLNANSARQHNANNSDGPATLLTAIFSNPAAAADSRSLTTATAAITAAAAFNSNGTVNDSMTAAAIARFL